MSLQQQVTLRYRSEGHLRFALPAALCTQEMAESLVAGLESMEGVYRVDLYGGQGKLAIRYLGAICDFQAVVRRLNALIGELAGRVVEIVRPVRATTGGDTRPTASPGSALRPWLRGKLEEASETVEAMRIMLARGFATLSDRRPRWISEFLNDLLMLYLIKLHWHSIITLWLPNPWTYRYEWAATFYLIYLSVQARLPKAA